MFSMVMECKMELKVELMEFLWPLRPFLSRKEPEKIERMSSCLMFTNCRRKSGEQPSAPANNKRLF